MSRQGSALALAALVIGITAGVAVLLQLRFERGDVYPPSSSLRSDPLGTRVLYEALGRLDGVVVDRNLTPLDELEIGDDTTLLLLGTSERARRAAATRLTAMARGGARVVVALAPPSDILGEPEHDTADGSEPGGWGITARDHPLDRHPETDRPIAAEVVLRQDLALPERLAWRSGQVLDIDDPAWQVVYIRDDDPVVVERRISAGSLVLVADTFPLSNEAMLSDRHSGLLAWIVGPARRVVFDEVHLGVVRPEGIMALVRSYRLSGFFAGLAVLAGLFVWRASTPLAAFSAEETGQDPRAQPRASSAALVHLLGRGLGGSELLAACVASWKRSFAGSANATVTREVDRAAAGATDCLTAYNQIHRLLKRTTRHE